MEYSVTHFHIHVSESLLETCRELLADAVSEAGYEAFEDTADGLDAYIQTHQYDAFSTKMCLEDFAIEDAVIDFDTEEVESQNWNEEYEKEVFEPIRVPGCVIYDAASPDAASIRLECEDDTNTQHPTSNTHHPLTINNEQLTINNYDYQKMEVGGNSQHPTPNTQHPTPNTQHPFAIAIDQQMAFGNGAHETTKMIVTELLSRDLHGKRLLDCGCGTGILSLVAKRCGAEHVTAYDIDEWSVENTKHNAEINGIELTDILLGDVSVLSHVDGVFDIIVANINRNILLADMPQIVETLSPDGFLILSGFYEEDALMLCEKASTLALYEVNRKVDNNWTMLVLHK